MNDKNIEIIIFAFILNAIFKKKIISNFIFEFIEHKCDENEKHFISLNLMCEKLQRTISFASRFRFNSFLQR